MAARGTIVRDGERASIEFERRLEYSIEDVWEAVTDPEQLASWLGHTVSDRREGGIITIESGPQHVPLDLRRTTGRILVWEPPHVVEYEWRQMIVEESTVRIELAEDGDATLLKLRHRWLSASNAGGFIPGWHAFLDRLAAHMAGEAVPDWQTRFNEVQGEYA